MATLLVLFFITGANCVCHTPIHVSSDNNNNFILSSCRSSFNSHITYRLQKGAKITLTECDFYALVFGHAKFIAGVQASDMHYCHHIPRPNCYEVYRQKINDQFERF